jgi:hypothetical protein
MASGADDNAHLTTTIPSYDRSPETLLGLNMKAFYTALVCMSVVSPAGAANRPIATLNNAELIELLSHHYTISSADKHGFGYGVTAEAFHQGGEYSLSQENGGDRGSYEIKNDQVCIKVDAKAPKCRRVSRVHGGKYRWIGADAPRWNFEIVEHP